MRQLVATALLASLAGLSGCGQTGPLYLPQDKAPAAEQVPAPADQPATTEAP